MIKSVFRSLAESHKRKLNGAEEWHLTAMAAVTLRHWHNLLGKRIQLHGRVEIGNITIVQACKSRILTECFTVCGSVSGVIFNTKLMTIV